ncbi:MAG: hypothetical protein GY862_39680 [Gammaproteobacteria bacterium]|nr:hypothetical protein [Gammaproteobacteria bacterium]
MENTENSSPEKTAAAPGLPFWKKILLGIALLIGMAGLALHGISPMNASTSPPEKTGNTFSTASNSAPIPLSQGPAGFSAQPSAAVQDKDAQDTSSGKTPVDWSIPLMKLGFSFVVGFCIGYALVTFMKITAIAAGLLLLALFGLQYGELIDINWHNMETHYDSFIVWLQPGLHDFREFITGNLPSSGMATAGILTAFKKK